MANNKVLANFDEDDRSIAFETFQIKLERWETNTLELRLWSSSHSGFRPVEGSGGGGGGVHGRVSSRQQGVINSLPQILMVLAHWTSAILPAHCIALFALYIFPARTDVYVFSAVLRVCVRVPPPSPVHDNGAASHSLLFLVLVSFFSFSQPKPRERRWLRVLCIPLGWWRGLSSARSLRPAADRSFTSTSLWNTHALTLTHSSTQDSTQLRGPQAVHVVSDKHSILLTQLSLNSSEKKAKRLRHFAKVESFNLCTHPEH